ncbi:acyl-CoA thioesterase [Pinibacter aurantiacus]|uniref:Acyl-CoA thioesterase n=1 Tax=Pinibacter aurantiacus TaxID=2851599 RepID=A0A9E2W2K2_9BACT|nr:acyl-CoA thioesterase [Pinibacter aurantiacus]MBV4357420.1 acyl-CoA thioesterase [Pinibacter aurantiacus]
MQEPVGDVYAHTIAVEANDIDELGHVNNIVYVRWVQEAAAAHWNYLADEETKRENAWVVVRHEIDYLSPALISDDVVAKTWVGESGGAKSVRYVDVCSATGKIFAKAKTTWCLLSAQNMRPKRIDEKMLAVLFKK